MMSVKTEAIEKNEIDGNKPEAEDTAPEKGCLENVTPEDSEMTTEDEVKVVEEESDDKVVEEAPEETDGDEIEAEDTAAEQIDADDGKTAAEEIEAEETGEEAAVEEESDDDDPRAKVLEEIVEAKKAEAAENAKKEAMRIAAAVTAMEEAEAAMYAAKVEAQVDEVFAKLICFFENEDVHVTGASKKRKFRYVPSEKLLPEAVESLKKCANKYDFAYNAEINLVTAETEF